MAGKMRQPFYRLHALTLEPGTRPDELAAALAACDAVQDRHRLAEGAVYASGCRRYLLDTGQSWRASQVAVGATSWGGQSTHRSRIDGTTWRCSCGARGTAADAVQAHADHAAQAVQN